MDLNLPSSLLALKNNFFWISLFFFHGLFGQEKESKYLYLVELEDKLFNFNRVEDPEKYLSKKAIQRRKKMGIAVDKTDLPVTKFYLEDLRKSGFQVQYTSKWLNAVVLKVDQKEDILPLRVKTYVKDYTWLGKAKSASQNKEKVLWQVNRSEVPNLVVGSKKYYGEAWHQIDMIQGHKLHSLGFQGQGVDMAIFDAGFHNFSKRKLIPQDQIKYTYDFVQMETEVQSDDNHGYQVMTCILADSPGKMVGTAPKVNAYLFRTEDDASETLIEEINWVKAAEVADSMGIDIITSSLGYTTHDEKQMGHLYADLDGRSTWIAKGATMAVKKGILVVNSMGNAGRSEWRYLGSPADAVGVLSIGSVDKYGVKSGFSSFGPNAANQQKPNITALGSNATVGSSYGGVTRASGTSFSTPIVSGMMACLIQAHPEKKPSHINWAVMQSASKRFRPDYEDGFGIPNFYLAHQMLGGAEPNEVQILEVNTKKCKNQIDIGLYIPQGKALTQEVFIQKNGFFGLFGGISKLGLESAMLEGSYIYKKIALTGKKLKKINFIFNIKTNDGEEQKGFSYTCRTKQLEAFETTALISD